MKLKEMSLKFSLQKERNKILRDKLRKKGRSNRYFRKCFKDKKESEDVLETNTTATPMDTSTEVDDDEPSIGDELLRLLAAAGVFKHNRTKRCDHMLTTRSDLIISHLIATCGCSVEKLPCIMQSILALWFGDFKDEKILSAFICSSSTLARSLERLQHISNASRREQFNATEGSVTIANACLLMDDANKKELAIKNKQAIVLQSDGVVSMWGGGTDASTSKKHDLSAINTVEALNTSFGPAAVKFHSATVDWAGAGNEVRLVLTSLDAIAAVMYSEDKECEALKHTSVVGNESITYRYQGAFRQLRVHPCQAHNVDRILTPVLLDVAQQSGLSHDATTAQGMYRIHYYIDKKYNRLYRHILCIGYGGEKLVPKQLYGQFGNVANNRWLSKEKQSKKLIKLLNYEAPPGLLKEVEDLLPNAGAFEMLKKMCCTMDDRGKTSAFMLAVFRLTDGVPGGVGGEGRAACWRIFGFLGSVEHRIGLCLMAAFLPIHQQWLAFVNRKSRLTNAQCHSTRLVESTVHSRQLLETVSAIVYDWKTALPEAFAQVKCLINDPAIPPAKVTARVQYWDNFMKTSCARMMEFALKYFRDIDLHIAWSFACVVDPILSPSVASGILQGLVECGLISDDDGIPPVVEPSPVAVPATEPYFRTTSTNHVYPGMTAADVTKKVRLSYTKDHSVAKALADAYGLTHPKIVAELNAFSKGKLRKMLEKKGSTWHVNDNVYTYYNSVFKNNFPFCSNSLDVNFGAVSITSTAVEAIFSIANNVANANHTNDSLSHLLDTHSNVKRRIISAIEHVVSVPNSNINCNAHRKRHLRTSESVASYLGHFVTLADQIDMDNVGLDRRTVRGLRGAGKRSKDTAMHATATGEELKKNTPTGAALLSVQQAATIIAGFDEAKVKGDSTFPLLPPRVWY